MFFIFISFSRYLSFFKLLSLLCFSILVLEHHIQLVTLNLILVLLNYWCTGVISFIIISPSFFVPPFIPFLFNYLPIYVNFTSLSLFVPLSTPGALNQNVLYFPSSPSFPYPFLRIYLFMTLITHYFCPLFNLWPPLPHTLSAGRRPVWRQIRSWTRTSVTGWVWEAATPSPTAVTVPTWQPPNAWPSVSSTWMASGSPMWHATSARSELLEGYCVVAKLKVSENLKSEIWVSKN